MADREETLRFKVEEAARAADALRDVAKEGKATGKQLDATAKQTKGSAKAAGEFTDKLAKMGVTLAAAKTLLYDTTMVAADQEAAIGRLQRAWSKADTTGERWNKTLDKLKERSVDLGVSYQGQIDGLAQLIDQTGNAKQAHEDLALAIDIAAAENRELKDTVEILRKARNGEVEEIKALDGVNKDLAEAIGKIEDPTRRAEAAIKEIRKQYTGAAEDTKGLKNQTEGLEQGAERLAVALGKVVIAMGDQTGGIIGSFLDWTGILSKEEATINNVVTAFENFADAITRLDDDKLLRLVKGGGLIGALTGVGPAADVIRELRGAQQADRAAEDAANVGSGDSRRGYLDTGPSNAGPMDELELALNAPAGSGGGGGKKEGGGGKKEDSGLRDAALAYGEGFLESEEEAREREQARLDQQAIYRAQELEEDRKLAEAQQQIHLNKLEWDQQQIKSARAVAKAKKDAAKVERQAAKDSAMAALEGVALFDKAGKMTLAVNAVKAGLRAGETWALAATPPPIGGPQYIPGAIAQTANALAQAAEAGKSLVGGASPKGLSGGGGGSAGPSGGGGASTPSPSTGFDLTAAQRPSGGISDSGLIVNLYSTHPASPEQARDLFEAVDSERANRPGRG